MCRNIAAGYLYLPGGHIEFAEPASEALRRELLEETNQKIAVGPLLLTTESTFHDGQSDHHEINLIFQAQLEAKLFHVEQFTQTGHSATDDGGDGDGGGGGERSEAEDGGGVEILGGGGLPVIGSAESHIDFVWVDLAAVTDLDIRPAHIKAWLASGGRAGGEADGQAEGGFGAGHLVEFEILFRAPTS